MRYAPEHKAETHRKIVKDASRRVRAQGIAGAAVSAVGMARIIPDRAARTSILTSARDFLLRSF
jgi:hypothetical protein